MSTHKTILVVEDDDQVRGLFRDLLEAHDINVLTACNGHDALNALRNGEVEIRTKPIHPA